MNIVDPLIQQYVEKYTTSEDDLLKEVANFTITHHPQSVMLSGHLQGIFLEMISRMVAPKRILEIGTFTGYSALCLAKGLADNGQLHTLEIREDDAAIAQQFFDRSLQKEKIFLHIGDAALIIDELDEIWDLVFIDADKVSYTHYFNLVFPKLRKNGFILADNVLYHGEVLKEKVSGKNAIAIRAFNDFVNKQNDVEKIMLPIRDGLYLIRKL